MHEICEPSEQSAQDVLIAEPSPLVASDIAEGIAARMPSARIRIVGGAEACREELRMGRRSWLAIVSRSILDDDGLAAPEAKMLSGQVVLIGDEDGGTDWAASQIQTPFTDEVLDRAITRLIAGGAATFVPVADH